MHSNISAPPNFCETCIYKRCVYDRENTVCIGMKMLIFTAGQIYTSGIVVGESLGGSLTLTVDPLDLLRQLGVQRIFFTLVIR